MLFDFSTGAERAAAPGGAAARSSSSARALDAARAALPLARPRRLARRCWRAGSAAARCSCRRTSPTRSRVPGTDADRAAAVLTADFGQRPEGTFTVVFRVRHSSDERLQSAAPAAARTRPRTSSRADTSGPSAAAAASSTASSRRRLSLQRRQGVHGTLRRALRGRTARGTRHRAAGDPARSRPPARLRPAPRRACSRCRSRCSCSPACSASRLALAVPFVFAACTIAGTLAAALRDRAARLRHVLRDEPRRADRARPRDRLLAAHRLPLPRRARRGRARASRRSSRTMATAGRAVVFSGVAVAVGLALPLVRPRAVRPHAGTRRGLLDPARVGRRRADAAAGAALALSAARPACACRGSPPAACRGPRSPGRSCVARVVVLVPTTALLLAAAAPVLFLRLTPGSLASLPRSTEATRGLAASADGVRPGRADADRDRRRRGRARRGAAAGRARGGRAPRRSARPRPGGLRRRDSGRQHRTSRATAATRA